jgi:hypothetical protein
VEADLDGDGAADLTLFVTAGISTRPAFWL